jgi:glycogen debranching enzyme
MDVPRKLPDANQIIIQLTADNHLGIYASQGSWYAQSVFGRDSLLVGIMLVDTHQELVRDIILTMSALQGLRRRRSTQEAPGRIMHEYRNLAAWKPGRPGKPLAQLASLLWGGSTTQMLTYFSTDSTALYLKLVAEYCEFYGTDILNQHVTYRNGQLATIGECTVAAANWLLERSRATGFVEHQRTNPWSVINQTWKDSPTAYLHASGAMPRFTRPVAYLLSQALTIDGLESVTPWIKYDPNCNPEGWLAAAETMRRQTLEQLWQPDWNYFAAMIDRDHSGRHQPVRTLSSDASWLMITSLFEPLTDADQQRYLTGLIETLFSDDFLTTVGIRCRALRHHGQTSWIDYHGSQTVWPVDSYFLALGLRKYGFTRLARELELRLFRALELAGSYYEYFVVSPSGTVVYRPDDAPASGSRQVPIHIKPEVNLAWTVAGYLRMQRAHHQAAPAPPPKDSWQYQLEERILNRLSFRLESQQSPPAITQLTPFGLNPRQGWLRLTAKILAESVHQIP